MWIMTTHGFVSIVRHNKIDGCLLVRGRVKADLEAVFPGYDVDTVPGSDYTYRMIIDEQDAAAVIAQAVIDIDYDSHFKDVAIARSPKVEHGSRSGALYAVWTAMANLQGYRPYSKLRRNQEVRITGKANRHTDWRAERDAYYNGQEPLWGNYGVPRAAIKPASESAAVFAEPTDDEIIEARIAALEDLTDEEIAGLAADFDSEETVDTPDSEETQRSLAARRRARRSRRGRRHHH